MVNNMASSCGCDDLQMAMHHTCIAVCMQQQQRRQEWPQHRLSGCSRAGFWERQPLQCQPAQQKPRRSGSYAAGPPGARPHTSHRPCMSGLRDCYRILNHEVPSWWCIQTHNNILGKIPWDASGSSSGLGSREVDAAAVNEGHRRTQQRQTSPRPVQHGSGAVGVCSANLITAHLCVYVLRSDREHCGFQRCLERPSC